MIYTIGRTTGYDLALRENPTTVKCGRDGESHGGSVWRTPEEAQAYIDEHPAEWWPPEWPPEEFGVYGVEADWDEDTYQVGDEPWRALLHDARLVKLT